MSLGEGVKLDDTELAKFFHDILLAFMEFTMGIVPGSRMRNVTNYIAETMFNLIDYKLLNLVEYNDPVATLDRYCHFLEDNYLVKRANILTVRERYATVMKIVLSYCIFGNSCKNLHTERFICPASLFGGFLIQVACRRRINVDASIPKMSSCETIVKLWDETLNPRNVILRG